jgi:hypothetical protein
VHFARYMATNLNVINILYFQGNPKRVKPTQLSKVGSDWGEYHLLFIFATVVGISFT